jgi:hypothetical protein
MDLLGYFSRASGDTRTTNTGGIIKIERGNAKTLLLGRLSASVK